MGRSRSVSLAGNAHYGEEGPVTTACAPPAEQSNRSTCARCDEASRPSSSVNATILSTLRDWHLELARYPPMSFRKLDKESEWEGTFL